MAVFYLKKATFDIPNGALLEMGKAPKIILIFLFYPHCRQ